MRQEETLHLFNIFIIKDFFVVKFNFNNKVKRFFFTKNENYNNFQFLKKLIISRSSYNLEMHLSLILKPFFQKNLINIKLFLGS